MLSNFIFYIYIQIFTLIQCKYFIRFIINLVCGPSTGEDIALHISVRMHENYVVRNSFQLLNWGPEEMFGHMPFHKGQGFEIIILCDPAHYKVKFIMISLQIPNYKTMVFERSI